MWEHSPDMQIPYIFQSYRHQKQIYVCNFLEKFPSIIGKEMTFNNLIMLPRHKGIRMKQCGYQIFTEIFAKNDNIPHLAYT